MAFQKPIMYDEQVFRDVCDGEYDDNGGEQCSKQTLKLNLMYTVAIFNLSFIMIFFGVFMDSVG